MQKTLKLNADLPIIPFQREYSSAFRFAFKRIIEGSIQKDISILLKSMFSNLGCYLQRMAVLDAVQEFNIYKSKKKDYKIIWGGRKTFEKRRSNKISADQWHELRNRPVKIQGETNQKSNRLFDFSKLDQDILIYKPNKNNKIEIPFKISKNQRKEIIYLLNNISKMPIQVLLKKNQICLTYEQEKIENIDKITNRILGIDMNPNNIGISITDNGSDVFHEVFKFTDKTRKNKNKRNHETKEIACRIIKLAEHFHVSMVVLEELTMGSRNTKKGRGFNRLVNNEWNRNLFQWQIRKLSDRYNIECKLVNCAYSSTIGNVLFRNLPDPCAAAKEIARRGPNKYVKSLCMYPNTNLSKVRVLNQWKEEEAVGLLLAKILREDNTSPIASKWVEIHNAIKKSGIKYRVPLEDINSCVFRFNSIKSGIFEHIIV